MKAPIAVLLCVASSLVGCARDQRPTTAQPAAAPAPPPLATDTTPPSVAPMTPASGVGDARPTAAFVPMNPERDKPSSKADVESILEIRQLLGADKTLSESARNITIIVKEGRVWLRGTVTTAAERASIERAARQAVNVVQVRNELSVME
jgi:hypothetical protein